MREVIYTDQAPKAVGPYSQAVIVGELGFVSGQIPLDPNTGELVSDDVGEQTHQVLKNLSAVITACGSSMADVVRVTIYLNDMNNFTLVNSIYGEYFSENPPARACVEVSRLPKDVAVEMDAICMRSTNAIT